MRNDTQLVFPYTVNDKLWKLKLWVRDSRQENIQTHKHAVVSQAVSCWCECVWRWRWKEGVYVLHHPQFSDSFLPGVRSWEVSTESHCRVKHAGSSTGSMADSFFPRMCIKASYASGGISAGNCRDSPYEQDDDIVFIVFPFLPPPPSCLNPHIASPCWLHRI